VEIIGGPSSSNYPSVAQVAIKADIVNYITRKIALSQGLFSGLMGIL
jgi:hypothetical protein